MKVGIVGLGLIGGSLAKAYKRQEDMTVYGGDIDASTQAFARMEGTIDEPLTDENLSQCELVLLAVESGAAKAWLENHASGISPAALVIDCCGVKREICRAGFALAGQYGFEYAGGHPMAGTHHWGYRYSRGDLFKGACMVIVPRAYDDIALLDRIKRAVLPAGFGSVSVATAETHDRIIAFTSQLAHAVSNAYMKSPTAREHRGFSAGSYRDLTRVAWLNPDMWTSLFLENRDNMAFELDTIIHSLTQYRDAIAQGDRETLFQLLDEGRKAKEEVDG